MAATSYTSLASAKAAAAEWFATAPEWVVGVHVHLVLGLTSLEVVIDREGVAREA